MSIENLKNFDFYAIRVSASSYTLEFGGRLNDEPVTYFAGTSYNLSMDNKPTSDALEKASEVVWPVLEQTLIDIVEIENQIRFIFENKKELLIWQNKDAKDNLMIVRKKDSDEWFTVQ